MIEHNNYTNGRRLDTTQYFLLMAKLVSTRSTCLRRRVGCILVDQRDHVMSTGYNGAPSGITHCIDSACAGARAKSGTNLDRCIAVHAEENALIQCKDTFAIESCFCTTFPCQRCLRMLMNTSCKKIYYINEYPGIEEGKSLWESSAIDRVAIQIVPKEITL